MQLVHEALAQAGAAQADGVVVGEQLGCGDRDGLRVGFRAAVFLLVEVGVARGGVARGGGGGGDGKSDGGRDEEESGESDENA